MNKKGKISDKEIGIRLKAARKRAGLKQLNAADHLKTSKSYISMIEKGQRRNKNLDVLMALAELYQVNVEFLIGLSDEMNGEEFIYTPLDVVPTIEKNKLNLDEKLIAGKIYFDEEQLNRDQIADIYLHIEKLINK